MLEGELRRSIERALPDGMAVVAADVAGLSGIRGSYALLLHVSTAVRFKRARTITADLSGWFVYAGSAHGAGGIGTRLGRHFRPEKAVRWHIDELTNSADAIMAFAMPDGRECDIIDRLLATGNFDIALPDFGSSDCRRCAAHLLHPYRS